MAEEVNNLRCPFCGNKKTRTLDTRTIRDDMSVRRRRECEICTTRFSTLERCVIYKKGSRDLYWDPHWEGIIEQIERLLIEMKEGA